MKIEEQQARKEKFTEEMRARYVAGWTCFVGFPGYETAIEPTYEALAARMDALRDVQLYRQGRRITPASVRWVRSFSGVRDA